MHVVCDVALRAQVITSNLDVLLTLCFWSPSVISSGTSFWVKELDCVTRYHAKCQMQRMLVVGSPSAVCLKGSTAPQGVRLGPLHVPTSCARLREPSGTPKLRYLHLYILASRAGAQMRLPSTDSGSLPLCTLCSALFADGFRRKNTKITQVVQQQSAGSTPRSLAPSRLQRDSGAMFRLRVKPPHPIRSHSKSLTSSSKATSHSTMSSAFGLRTKTLRVTSADQTSATFVT